MKDLVLILYSREGCCLCEGLQKRLSRIPLDQLTPPLSLQVVDIDLPCTPENIRSRYDQKVPVLAIWSLDLKLMTELPRVSPRLVEAGLLNWLQKFVSKVLLTD